MKVVSDFIEQERSKFETQDNNLFAMTFGNIVRYLSFLEIIFGRYNEASKLAHRSFKNLIENSKADKKQTQIAINYLLEVQRRDSELLHLEIETFYLFAKILLDKIARAMELYFGKARKASLDSHDDLTKNIARFVETKKTKKLPEKLFELAVWLKRNVCDYRDKQITHEKSPRTIKGTVFGSEEEDTRIITTRIYPTDHDKQIESLELNKVYEQIKVYLKLTIDFIVENRAYTGLKRI